MKTNVAITLTDEQRSHLANLFDGKESKRLATRQEVTRLVLDCIDCALQFGIEDLPSGERIGNTIIEDINRGGWTLIGEPPGIA